jgi:hypothetical protein
MMVNCATSMKHLCLSDTSIDSSLSLMERLKLILTNQRAQAPSLEESLTIKYWKIMQSSANHRHLYRLINYK